MPKAFLDRNKTLWVRPVETAWGHPLISRFSRNNGR